MPRHWLSSGEAVSQITGGKGSGSRGRTPWRTNSHRNLKEKTYNGKKEVKFSLVFRDMWQSAGKYVPRVDQLVKVAPAIIRMGCFDRVKPTGAVLSKETCFSGKPEQRRTPMDETVPRSGHQDPHAFDRALNGLRMSPMRRPTCALFVKSRKRRARTSPQPFAG